MFNQNNNSQDRNWKSRTYVLGAASGTLFGLLAAYLFARAAEEDAIRNPGVKRDVPTAQIMTLMLAAVGVLRQISELGKSKK